MHKPKIWDYTNTQVSATGTQTADTYTLEDNLNLHGLRAEWWLICETLGDIMQCQYSVQCVPRDQTAVVLDFASQSGDEIDDKIWMQGTCLVTGYRPTKVEFLPSTSRSCHKDDKLIQTVTLSQKVVGTGNLRAVMTKLVWITAI